MTIANDSNAPVRYKGSRYKALTMADIGDLIESLPKRLVPRQLIPFVTVSDAMKYGRSPFGLPALIEIVSENSGHDDAKQLTHGEQLELSGRLTDRFYGFGLIDEQDDDEGEPPEAFQEGPAS